MTTWDIIHFELGILMVREIRTMQEIGLTQGEVAAIFGVSIITIYDVWNGRTWKEGVEHDGGGLG